MKRLNFSLIIIFLITIMSVFGQERSLEQSIGETSYGKLSSADIYGDYFLFSSEKSVSLDLEGARLIDVLKMLSQQTGLNFISTEAVRGRSLTAYLKEVPLKQAMDILFKANNLTYEFYPEAKMFVVKEMGRPTIELKTKVYHLKYARALTSNMQKEIDKILKETKGIVEEEGGEDGGGQQQKKTGIKEIISQVLTDVGKVVVNDATNSLIVVDVPSQFPVIDELVSKLDVPPVKIMIEVEILDVDKDAVDK
ncbi:MAG: hypothetical protein K9L61_01435, partial [Candidatus Omnitrophica bacterium]|nr:hypothetical protein [Candidatus Omnitrophota bacterium]